LGTGDHIEFFVTHVFFYKNMKEFELKKFEELINENESELQKIWLHLA
jgi:hypothetical protein